MIRPILAGSRGTVDAVSLRARLQRVLELQLGAVQARGAGGRGGVVAAEEVLAARAAVVEGERVGVRAGLGVWSKCQWDNNEAKLIFAFDF